MPAGPRPPNIGTALPGRRSWLQRADDRPATGPHERVPAPGPAWSVVERNPGLELFFDLVFVLCVARLAEVLHEDPHWPTAGRVLLLFVPVWWTWNGVTFALNRFPTDDNATNTAVVAAAAASGAMALAIPSVPGAGNDWFALGYATVRLIMAWMYLRARTREQRLTRFYATGFATVAAVWLLSTLAPEGLQPWLWVVAMLGDILLPALADRAARILPVDQAHLPDRFSAFTIIVLGEAAVSPVAAAHAPLTTAAVLVLADGFVLAALLWWGFFDRHAWQTRYRLLADHRNSGRAAYVVCAYLHFPLVAGVVFLGAGTQIAVSHPADPMPPAGAAIAAAGIAAYLLSLTAMAWVLRTPRAQSLTWWRVALLAALALWLRLGHSQPAATFLAGCVGVLLVHTLANIHRAGQHIRVPVPEHGA